LRLKLKKIILIYKNEVTVIVGNKIDLIEQEAVSFEEGESYSKVFFFLKIFIMLLFF